MVLPNLATLVAIAVTYGVLFGCLRRPWTAGGLTLYALGFVLLASFVKQAYLGMAVTLADVHFFLLRPRENFKLFFNYPMLGLASIAVAVGAIACCLTGLRTERPVRILARPRTGGWLRVLVATVSIALGVGASLTASRDSHARATNGDSYAAFLTMYEQQHPRGIVGRLNLFFGNRSFDAVMPPNRRQVRFAMVDEPAGGRDVGAYPDMLLVLEESAFDPRLIRGCPVAQCDSAMFRTPSAAQRSLQGPLLVHSTGGGTWLSEFAIMSGLDWRVFGRGGGYAPVSLAPRLQRSLPLRLRMLGYRTIAIYPTDGNFLSATTAYEQYGFEEFYDARELGMPDDWGETRDAMIFDKTLSLLARHDDGRPMFVFVLTIRNHGPHGRHPEKIPESFREIGKTLSLPMADYLARMRDSSRDYERLASSWLQSPRPRVLGWFGDHQPEAAWDFTEQVSKLDADRVPKNANDAQLQYLTYYQLSANFGESERLLEPEALDISYLGAEMVAFAELPLDAGERAAREMAVRCNGQMFDCVNRELLDDYLSYRVHDLHALR